MFSQKIMERIQSIPAYDTPDKYIVDVMSKFCRIALSERIPLEKKIEHTETMLELLDLFKAFEQKESRDRLATVQQNLFQGSQSSKIGLDMAIAMNTIRQFLKKGQHDSNAQKFYMGIDAAIDFLKDRKEKLLREANQNSQVLSASPFSFLAGKDPANEPLRPVSTDDFSCT